MSETTVRVFAVAGCLIAATIAVQAVFQPAPPVAFDQQFGTDENEWSSNVTHDGAGNSYQSISAAGAFPGQTHAGLNDVVLRKTDSAGGEIWVRQIGTSAYEYPGRTLAVTSSGISAVSGRTAGSFPGFTNLGIYDVLVALWDADGNQIAIDQFGTTGVDEAYGVATDGASFYVAGHTNGTLPGQTSEGDFDCFVAVYDLSGNRTDLVQFGTSARDTANGIALDASGNVYVTGFTGGVFGTALGGTDGFVVKLDSNLNEVASENYGTSANDNYKAISIGSGGDMVVAGATFGAIPGETAQGWDIIVQKIDPVTLGVSWTRQLGITANSDFGEDVVVEADGTSYTVGSTRGLEELGAVPVTHGAVIALDAAGNDLWNDQFYATGAALFLNGASIDATGRLWAIGNANGEFAGKLFRSDGILRVYELFSSGVTDITACGTVISTPGDYRLANDLSGSGVCIDVSANDVTIDLNGHDLTVQESAGTDVGIDLGGTTSAQVTDLSGSPGGITIESGTGIDIQNTSSASIVGITLDFYSGSSDDVAIRCTMALNPTVDDVSFDDQGSGNTAIVGDNATGATLSDVSWTSIPDAGSRGISVSGWGAPVIQNVSASEAEIRLDGENMTVDGLGATFTGSVTPADTRITGSGAIQGFVQAGGSFESAGSPGNSLTYATPAWFRFQGDLELGDGLVVDDPLFRRDDPTALVRLTGTLGTTSIANALFAKATVDTVGLLVDSDPGASALWTEAVSFQAFDAVTQANVGGMEFVRDELTFGRLTANVGFRLDNTAESPDQLADGATEIVFFTNTLANADLQTYRNGALHSPPCATQPDGNTTFCPGHAGDATFVFAHETATGCGTYTTPGIVVYQDIDFDVTSATACLDLRVGMTWECGGRKLNLPAGSPGSETIGALVGAPGIRLQNCNFDLDGADTVGVDVTADDATLYELSFAHNATDTIGIRASLTYGLDIVRDTHTGSGPDGPRTGIDVDDVTDLRIDGSSASDGRAYIMRVSNSVGQAFEAIWIGEIDLSGIDGTNRILVSGGTMDGGIDPNGNIEIFDGMDGEFTTFIPADAEAIRNLAATFGPQFTDAIFEVDPGRSVGILEENLAAGATFDGSVRFRTQQGPGFTLGEIEFHPAPGTYEDGIADPWAFADRDSVSIGTAFALENTFDLTFAQMTTPDDTTGLKIILGGSGDDAIANGACITISLPGEPWAFRCDRDLGQPFVEADVAHVQFCGDGIANDDIVGDDCDPPGSGKCRSDCTIPPPSDLIDVRVSLGANPADLVLEWDDSGEGPYEIYRSTDPSNVEITPENKIGLTSGTTWTDAPPEGVSVYYRVVPAP